MVTKNKEKLSVPKKGTKNLKHFKISKSHSHEFLENIATNAEYIGSNEHKNIRRETNPRFDSSKCERAFNRPITIEEANKWLKAAIREGHISSDTTHGFPKYVWSKINNVYFEARFITIDKQKGTYKGFPLLDTMVPKQIKDLYND